MQKIFVDAGSHEGKVSRKFHRKHPNYKLYAFEPNPYINFVKYPEGTIFSAKALWIEDGYRDFYLYKDIRSEGCSLMYEKQGKAIDREHPVGVKCIDFSKWIMDTLNRKDKIVLKMDIEGAEYKVLNKMIKDNSIEYINKLYIEFHIHKLVIDRNIHDELIDKLKQVKTLKLCGEMKV